MSENVELRSDIRITAGIQGVKNSREPVSEEARKKFAQELERKLAQDKKKNKKNKDDEIIISADESHENEDEKPEQPRPIDQDHDGGIDILA